YKSDIDFFLIYIREAHPSDGWQTPQNLYDDVIYEAPQTEEARAEIAGVCQIAQDIRLPMLLDGIDNDVERKYISAPIRLFVIDPEGRITFNGAPGPQGFDPKTWRDALKAQTGG
ncbi:unnamed protein product, partial [Laminaria digitata]